MTRSEVAKMLDALRRWQPCGVRTPSPSLASPASSLAKASRSLGKQADAVKTLARCDVKRLFA